MAVDISDDVLICDEDVNDDVVSNCDIDGCDDANPDDVVADKNQQITGISADDDFDPRKATAEILKNEQRTDKSLAHCWSLAERDKAGYFVKDGILYRHQKLYGFDYEQLVLPFNRRAEVMKMAHDTAGCHLEAKKTKEKNQIFFYLAYYCF